jgi:hypothetical protein
MSQEVPGRILHVYLHEAPVELQRRSGQITRLDDNQSALEFVKGAAALGGRTVHAVSSGRPQLLIRPF